MGIYLQQPIGLEGQSAVEAEPLARGEVDLDMMRSVL